MTPLQPPEQIAPLENDNPYNSFSRADFIQFWTYACKNRRIGLIVYPVLSLTFLLCYFQLVQQFSGNVLGMDSLVISVLTVGLFTLFFIYLPSMPGEYMHRFKETLREDISKDQLKQQFLDSTAKSLEHISVILTVLFVSCVSVYAVAKGLEMSDFPAWVLVGGTGVNIYLVALVLVSLGKYNREHLGKTFIDKEYKRYTSFSNYKRLLTILGIADVLGIIVLVTTQFLSL